MRKTLKGIFVNSRPGRTIRNTVLGVLTLLVLFVSGGVVYVRLSDGATAKPSLTTLPASLGTGAPPKPAQPAANAPEGVAIQAVTSPVVSGSNSSVTITTNAKSICSIRVVYNGIASKDSGLVPRTADAYGTVIWTWTVDRTVPPGNWPIQVTCRYHSRTAVVDTSVRVTNRQRSVSD